jgi:serine/threonine protein phosphatase PrpC
MPETALQPPIYFLQHQAEGVTSMECAGVEIAVYSQRSPIKQTPNEDAAVIIPVGHESLVMAVADGVGGSRGGEQASNLAITTLAETIQENCHDPSLMRVSILDGIEKANRLIQALNIGAATTIAIIEYHAGTIRPYHVGDSMILVTGLRGRMHYQSVSHSPVGFAMESGMIAHDEVMMHEDRHVVFNVVGDASMRIEIGPTLQLAARDTGVIASDGLSDNVPVAKVIELLRKGPLAVSAQRACELASKQMAQHDVQPSKPDDLTLIAFRRAKSCL